MDNDITYMVTATLVIEDKRGQTMRQVPTFYVVAVSEDNARAIARDIIEVADNGDLASIHMTVARMADIVIA